MEEGGEGEGVMVVVASRGGGGCVGVVRSGGSRLLGFKA